MTAIPRKHRRTPKALEQRHDAMVRAFRPTRPRPDKGRLGGRCNLTACKQPGATWFNTSTRHYYCASCALDITSFAKKAGGFDICFPTTGDAERDARREFGCEEVPA